MRIPTPGWTGTGRGELVGGQVRRGPSTALFVKKPSAFHIWTHLLWVGPSYFVCGDKVEIHPASPPRFLAIPRASALLASQLALTAGPPLPRHKQRERKTC